MTEIPPPLDTAWFRFVLGFILGMIMGSFSTMLAYRLPRRLSIVFPRSHCPSCKTTLDLFDLIPIFSWLAAKGHCRHCHAKIGAQYLVIEIAVSLAFAVATTAIGFVPALLIAYAAIIALVVSLCIKIL